MSSEKRNPLDEAGETPTLDEFYNREPDELTDEELERLVAAHRAEREKWDAKQEAKEDKPKKVRKKS